MAEQNKFTVKFWGVRGSVATPQQDMLKYGGNTSCVEMRCGDEILIFDAGTGIKGLGESIPLDSPMRINLFLSHTHMDHINGFPFFRPSYVKHNKIRIWAGHLMPKTNCRQVMESLMEQPFFPVSVGVLAAWMEFIDFKAGNTITPLPDVVVKTAPLNHPNGATGYRVEYGGKSICYVTDTEHFPDRLDENIVELIRDADIVIYDATYTNEEYPNFVGWGHSTWQEGVKLADAANVKKLVIFHHEPSHNDAMMDKIGEEAEKARPGGVIVAREGMELTP